MGALVMLVIASGGGKCDGEQGLYDTVYTFFKFKLKFYSYLLYFILVSIYLN